MHRSTHETSTHSHNFPLKKKKNWPITTGNSFIPRETSCFFIPFQLHSIKAKICPPKLLTDQGQKEDCSRREVLSQGLSYNLSVHLLPSGHLSEGVGQAEISKVWEFCLCSMESALPAARTHLQGHLPCL